MPARREEYFTYKIVLTLLNASNATYETKMYVRRGKKSTSQLPLLDHKFYNNQCNQLLLLDTTVHYLS